MGKTRAPSAQTEAGGVENRAVGDRRARARRFRVNAPRGRARELADRIAAQAPLAVQHCKRSCNHALNRGLVDDLAFEAASASDCMTSEDLAAAALILFVILQSGLFSFAEMNVADLNWAVFGAAGFLAGYSEPFFFGVIGRISAGVREE